MKVMADTENAKARGGQLKARPVTFYPPSPEFRDKLEAVAKAKMRTTSSFINFALEEFMKTDPEAMAYDESGAHTQAA